MFKNILSVNLVIFVTLGVSMALFYIIYAHHQNSQLRSFFNVTTAENQNLKDFFDYPPPKKSLRSPHELQ